MTELKLSTPKFEKSSISDRIQIFSQARACTPATTLRNHRKFARNMGHTQSANSMWRPSHTIRNNSA